MLIEFFYNSHISAKLWQNPARIDGEEQNKKNCPLLVIEPRTSWSSLWCSADCARQLCIGQEISEVNFVSRTTSHIRLCSFLESIGYDRAWPYTKAMVIQIGKCWLSSFSGTLVWWSRGSGFNLHWGQFYILVFSINAGIILPVFVRKWRIIDKLQWVPES